MMDLVTDCHNPSLIGHQRRRTRLCLAPFIFLGAIAIILFSFLAIVAPDDMGKIGFQESLFLKMSFGQSCLVFLAALFFSAIYIFRAGEGRSIKKGLSFGVAYIGFVLVDSSLGFNAGIVGNSFYSLLHQKIGLMGVLFSALICFLTSICLFKQGFCWAAWLCDVLTNESLKRGSYCKSDTVIENGKRNVHINNEFAHDEFRANQPPLVSALAEFGFSCRLVEEKVGPIVTQFFLSLAPGIKSQQIKCIENDLSREISAESVRVNRVVPGKPYISVEVPNQERNIVSGEELFKFHPDENESLILGVDAVGERETISLKNHPHILIGGCTGSGKTVLLQNLILSVIKFTSAKLVLIDPKRLDLTVFKNSSSLACPIVCEQERAETVLSQLVQEMENRYELMQELGARNTEQLKAKGRICPRIVVVVDELADIIQFGSIQENLIRLSAKARACGIHLILSTQRPCAKTFSTRLKSNIKTRIALTTVSQYDSRIILEEGGAEQLLSNGDMLLLNETRIKRLHCGYLDADFIEGEVESQGQEYLAIFEQNNVAHFPQKNIDQDLYLKAINLLDEHNELSISKIQRCLKVGYNKAANIEQQLIQQGYLGEPLGGNRGRAVLQ